MSSNYASLFVGGTAQDEPTASAPTAPYRRLVMQGQILLKSKLDTGTQVILRFARENPT
ncbi:MAG: hypothetical protein Q8R10_01300 [Pseudomonas sp.]|uniref:hypothetical protein n=1 Tax=Pseudomonas sp. TaxID=306 RepID=UPI002734CA89|nr:hypothetical protein [Pseudomonas sp.]MDP3845050.1 hypothetical protein [Pseudomonas sp.]